MSYMEFGVHITYVFWAYLSHTNWQTWKKTIDFTQARFYPKLFYLKKCINFHKRELVTKQRKMYLTSSMSKTRLPHTFRGKNYVTNLICSSF